MTDELKIELGGPSEKIYDQYKTLQNLYQNLETIEEDLPAILKYHDFLWVAISYSTCLKSNVAFVPPNPKEFVSAISTFAFLGELAT